MYQNLSIILPSFIITAALHVIFFFSFKNKEVEVMYLMQEIQGQMKLSNSPKGILIVVEKKKK